MPSLIFFFFFNDTATTEIYTLSLHDALPILETADRASGRQDAAGRDPAGDHSARPGAGSARARTRRPRRRSEEHTSELQSRLHPVCRLLLEKKKTTLTPRRRTTPEHTPQQPR